MRTAWSGKSYNGWRGDNGGRADGETGGRGRPAGGVPSVRRSAGQKAQDRKSTRLNSSHEWSSYAVFCLKKKKKQTSGQNAHERKNTRIHSSHDVISNA